MNAINELKNKASPLLLFFQKHQKLFALVSFCLGLASFFLINRQSRSVEIIAIALLISWLWLMIENLVTEKFASRLGINLPSNLFKFIAQVIHQESLFFVLPFFLLTTTWQSGQAPFTLIIILLAIVSIIDPIYYRWLSKNPILLMLFHGMALFLVLLTALPIVLYLTTEQSYQYATLTTLILLFPTLFKLVIDKNIVKGVVVAIFVSITLSLCLWFGRYFVPPATLWLNQFSVDVNLDEAKDESVTQGRKEISQENLHQNGLYAFSAIRAPRGLTETIHHVWIKEGEIVDTIALTISGGRKEGYRTWTHKTNFPKEAKGDWQIQVITSSGQMIGLLRFRVI